LSEKFLELAKKEVREDIDAISLILNACKNDSDISKNSVNIEKKLHKIKGLAPMMEQIDVEEVSKIGDKFLKYIIANGEIKNSYQIVNELSIIINECFDGNNNDAEKIKNKIKTSFPNI